MEGILLVGSGDLAAQATGSSAQHVVCRGDDAHLPHEDGRVEKAATAAAA